MNRVRIDAKDEHDRLMGRRYVPVWQIWKVGRRVIGYLENGRTVSCTLISEEEYEEIQERHDAPAYTGDAEPDSWDAVKEGGNPASISHIPTPGEDY